MIKDYARLFERKKKGKNWSACLQIFLRTENEWNRKPNLQLAVFQFFTIFLESFFLLTYVQNKGQYHPPKTFLNIFKIIQWGQIAEFDWFFT